MERSCLWGGFVCLFVGFFLRVFKKIFNSVSVLIQGGGVLVVGIFLFECYKNEIKYCQFYNEMSQLLNEIFHNN